MLLYELYRAIVVYRQTRRRYNEALRRKREMRLLDLERERVKINMFGDNVKAISKCYHDWRPRPALLFGYMRVDAQCIECKTWWAPPAYLEG